MALLAMPDEDATSGTESFVEHLAREIKQKLKTVQYCIQGSAHGQKSSHLSRNTIWRPASDMVADEYVDQSRSAADPSMHYRLGCSMPVVQQSELRASSCELQTFGRRRST